MSLKKVNLSVLSKKKWISIKYFLLIAPFLILTILFAYYPLYGWIYAFYDYRAPLKLSQTEFVGFKWFEFLFSNKGQVNQLFVAIKNTLVMSFLNLVTSGLPLLFALFLNEIRSRRFKSMIQIITTLPNFISWVLVYSIAFALLSTTGMVNTILLQLNVIDVPLKILESGDYTYIKMLIWNIWKGLGWGTLLYMAAISGADQELYEVAKIDGAHRFHLMRYITLPALMPTYLVLLMLSIANALNNGIDQYYVFQNAFNRNQIQVLDLYLYNLGIGTSNSISLATAISIMKSLISLSLLIMVNGVSKKTRGISII